MDRPVFIPNTLISSESLGLTPQSAMIEDGAILWSLLNNIETPMISGLAVTPNDPENLRVNIGPGICTSYEPCDPTGYGSNSLTNANSVTKIGNNTGSSVLDFTGDAPATTGQSADFLIEVQFTEQPTGLTVLTYRDPTTGDLLQGPGGSNTSDATILQQVVSIRVKPGNAASSGSQVQPSPDAGWTGLAYVTLAHGQTTIGTGDITPFPDAPFISTLLLEQFGGFLTSADAANAYVKVSQLSQSATAYSVAQRDSSGNITANIFVGNATLSGHSAVSDFATNAGQAANATQAAYAVQAGNAIQAQNSFTANTATFATNATYAAYVNEANNSVQLGGVNPSVSSAASTIVQRDANAAILASVFHGPADTAGFGDMGERMHASEPGLDTGFVVALGGQHDIEKAKTDRFFGVITDAPGVRMNTEDKHGNRLDPDEWPFVAWAGRVPVKVLGPVKKHQYLGMSSIPGVAAALNFVPPMGYPVVGHALEDRDGLDIGLVFAVVRAVL
jgi:hypothetical protein